MSERQDSATVGTGDVYPELYDEYIEEKIERLLYAGTYLNPLDSKLL